LQAESIVEADIDVEDFTDAETEAENFKSMMAGLEDGAVVNIDNSPFL
jgi:hypothetical protein